MKCGFYKNVISVNVPTIFKLSIFFYLQVCEEAKCPNIGECWGGGEHATATATIMVGTLI